MRPRAKSAAPSHPKIRKLQFRWAASIPKEQWAVYRTAMETLRSADIPFLLGGGFAFATYTGLWRNTKDIDFYIHPRDSKRTTNVLLKAGFDDYFSRQPYDRSWSFRSFKSEVIADALWGMGNHLADVDDVWFARAPSLSIRNQKLLVIPPEELIWCKIYIIQRPRCDWTDCLNIIYARGQQIDWKHLLNRLGDDTPLLAGLLSVYGWLAPGSARKLPQWLWDRLNLPVPTPTPHAPGRSRWLDSRHWFAGDRARGETLEV